MPSNALKSLHRVLGYSTLTLGLLCVAIVSMTVWNNSDGITARLVREKKEYPWITLSGEEVMSGALIPANTNVVFHLPDTGFSRITRETLLGLKGKTTRYWGYCFPANYDPTAVSNRAGFAGLIFLSEREREVRAAQEKANKPTLRISRIPTESEIAQVNDTTKPAIRHQLEIFKPSTLCYIMSESSLAIGLDIDGDRLNAELEREVGTDPHTPDMDGDGVSDGVEYRSGTIPTIRDTDGDGVIDGIEDSNWNGYTDAGETDPRVWDSDRDNLCDGMCKVRLKRQYIYMGEDKNLNGDVDLADGETDPTKFDTDGDGLGDEVEFMRCLAAGKDDCPSAD